MLVARLCGKPIGLAYIVENGGIAYLFFFAVEKSEREKGYGTKILSHIKEKTRGKKLFIAREQIDERAENNAERISRREFYLRNGFTDTEYRLKEANVVYDVMTIGGEVTPEEYRALIENWAGKFILRFVDMRLLPPEK